MRLIEMGLIEMGLIEMGLIEMGAVVEVLAMEGYDVFQRCSLKKASIRCHESSAALSS